MKFTQVNESVLRLRAPRQGNYKFLKEFDDSGIACAEVVNYSHKHAASCMSSLSKTIKRYKMEWLRVQMQDGKVYIYRVNKIEKK